MNETIGLEVRKEDEIKTAVQKMGYVCIPKIVLYDPLLTDKELIVYIALLSRDWSGSKSCFPSLVTISKESRLSKRTVQRSIDGLIEKGFITKDVRRKEEGGFSSNLYTLKRLDDIYCTDGDWLNFSEDYKKRMVEAKKGYLIDHISKTDSDVDDDKDEDTSEDVHAVELEDRTNRLLGALVDVDERASKAKERAQINRELKNKKGKKTIETDDKLPEQNKRPLNVSDVESVWRYEEQQAWSDAPLAGKPWNATSKGIAAKLIKEWGAENLIALIEDVIRNWADYKERYRISGYPSMKNVAYWQEAWFNELDRGKTKLLSNREKAIAQGEYDGPRKDISFAEFG